MANQTDKNLEVSVRIEKAGLSLGAELNREFTLTAGGTEVIEFWYSTGEGPFVFKMAITEPGNEDEAKIEFDTLDRLSVTILEETIIFEVTRIRQ